MSRPSTRISGDAHGERRAWDSTTKGIGALAEVVSPDGNRVECFGYDKLNRLECADFDPAPGCPENYSYAPDGNIVHKPGFGLIDYDPNHPHAAASGPGGPFQYDDVGNQIARAGATIEYTPFDLPKRFTLDQGGTVELDYDRLSSTRTPGARSM